MKKIYFLLLTLFFFNSANSQIINIPDGNFKAALLSANTTNHIASINSPTTIGQLGSILTSNYYKIDTNNDGEIQISEAQFIKSLELNDKNISNFTGIEAFLNLEYLRCENNLISNINIAQNTNLKFLECQNNQLTNLDVTQNTSLLRIFCFNNQITNLNLSQNPLLIMLYCSSNLITTLNISPLSNLIWLACQANLLTNLDVSNNNLLQILFFDNNQISTINLSNLANLGALSCSSNQLTNLDLSINVLLHVLYCANNQLTSLNTINNLNLSGIYCGSNLFNTLDFSHLQLLNNLSFDNNPNLVTVNIRNNNLFWDNGGLGLAFNNNPNLQYICADASDVLLVQQIIDGYGYTNCYVNAYCNFADTGNFYTMNGNSKYDLNSNGCDVFDLPLSNLKFNITDGVNSGSLISNTTGNYSIPVQAGTHTITPVLENPTYFTVSPTTVSATFPTQTSPFTQNFCVTANGIHPDLEVTLLPINAARPGFDATYKIIYTNKGNTTQSGTVNLSFNDAIIDFVSAIPATASQSVNNLSWNFANLLPFETREITLTLNVNSPMENPAVNSGDILNYTTTITSSAIDDLPNDNTFVFNQTVVNSFDPNDKTCLEGATIPPSKVGDYVHYMIRFENNGTANAQNIVVKDIIDTAKFDVSSLIPMKGSHSFVTNISSGNKVEFIFENINLPFDNANNDGYVAFKIKTKPTLANGDTFSNTASIYFDYNFPIVTNTATTTIAALSIQDFVFSNYFTIYPNPVSKVLSITQKENITISSINIYNTLGQLVLVIPNAKNIKTIDVSSLTSGNYFIKINADKGISNTKFVKS